MLNGEGKKKYDLEERSAKFGEDIIELTTKLPMNDLRTFSFSVSFP